ncbi:MAG: ABC transporter permease [Acidobacteriaceae bacterium]
MSLFRRVYNLLRRSRLQHEIDAELESHVEMRTAHNIDAGMSREESRRDALLRLGNPVVMRERTTAADTALVLDTLFRDARYAWRQLRKSPAFTVSVIVTLALGIGVNIAVFSIVDAVLLRPLPYKNSGRLVVIWQTDAAHRGTGAWFDPYREYEEWKRSSNSFEELAAMSWATDGQTLTWHDKPVGILAMPASVDFFSLLGADAQLGRTFHTMDLSRPCTLVLSYPFWKEKLGSPGDIVGQMLTVDRSSCFIAGVMPQNFAFYPKAANAWSLITPSSPYIKKPWYSMTGVFGLLKPGVTHAQAEAELNAIEKRILPEGPPAMLSLLGSATPIVLDLQDNFTWLAGRELRKGLWVLSGAVSLVLLIACLNLANLMLNRADARSREMAIRAAIGSSRVRLVRQMLIESLMLAICGTGMGVLLAVVLLRWFRAVSPVELPPGHAVSLNWQVLLYAVILSILSAIGFGLIPAWRASRVDLIAVLKSSAPGAGANPSAQRMSEVLVVSQIAISLLLFVTAGLLGASLRNMAATRLGYRTDRVLTAGVNLDHERYADPDARSRFAQVLTDKISALPEVEAVAMASAFTPSGESPLSIEGDASAFSAGGIAAQSVSGNFFSAMRIPLLAGRFFDARDLRNTQPVAIVNRALASKYFPNTNPVGRSLKLSRADDTSEPWLTVVGVVAGVKTTTVFQEMGYIEQPAVYRPLPQSPPQSVSLMVLAKDRPLGLVEGIEERLATLDRGLLLTDVSTMKDQQSAALAHPRFRALLFSSFAFLALVVALVGLYGVVSQMITQRTREIAIRMALGATRKEVLGSVVRKTCVLAIFGILIGIAASAIGERMLAGLLYGVRAENFVMFAAASAIWMLTGLVACWNPARRAANIDPMQVLRGE